jgi:hypothetical protein
MIEIFIKAIRDGHKVFIVPHRNLDAVLGLDVLGMMEIQYFAQIPMNLAGSGTSLPLVCFTLQNDDALDILM